MVMKKISLILAACVGCHAGAMAQSWSDFIADQVENYIEDAIGEAATSLWEGFLESNIQSSIKDDAKKIAAYQPDTAYLVTLRESNPKWANAYSPLSDINCRLSELPGSYLYNVHGAIFRNLGQGSVGQQLSMQRDSVLSANVINEYSQLLNAGAMQALKAQGLENDRHFFDLLHSSPRLVMAFNRHPELIALQQSWSKQTFASNDAAQLQYWGTMANHEDAKLPKKKHLPNGMEVKMSPKYGNYVLATTNDGKNLCEMDSRRNLTSCSIDMLNLHPMPLATYVVDGITYTTDMLGRVIKVEQQIGKQFKGKGTQKRTLKTKEILPLSGTQKTMKPYMLADKRYRGSECRLNLVGMMMTPQNKTALKNVKKAIKNTLKTNSMLTVVTELYYEDDLMIPAVMQIKVDGYEFVLSNNGATAMPFREHGVTATLSGIPRPEITGISPRERRTIELQQKRQTPAATTPSTQPRASESPATTPARSQTVQTGTTSTLRGKKKLNGSIGQYPVTLTLELSDFNGTEIYNSRPQNVFQLKCVNKKSVSDNGNGTASFDVTINEIWKDKVTGTYRGHITITNGRVTTFAGTFVNSQDKSFAFSLKE